MHDFYTNQQAQYNALSQQQGLGQNTFSTSEYISYVSYSPTSTKRNYYGTECSERDVIPSGLIHNLRIEMKRWHGDLK